MPWFHFHLSIGDAVIEDPEGLELPDRTAAIRQALVSVREILAEDIRMGRTDLTLQLALADETGVFHVTTCTDAMATEAAGGV